MLILATRMMILATTFVQLFKMLILATIFPKLCVVEWTLFTAFAATQNSEVGTSNIISKAQRNKVQRSFQPVKAQRKLRDLFFLISEAQRNFRNELFDSVDAQRNSAIAERHFRTKLKRNLTSAIEISQHRANTALFAIFDRKEQIIC